jgi:hypothetical protein
MTLGRVRMIIILMWSGDWVILAGGYNCLLGRVIWRSKDCRQHFRLHLLSLRRV